MRASVAWLAELCDTGLAPAALVERLTHQGLETEAPEPLAAPAREIVAARFAQVTPVPRTNYLRIVADIGDGKTVTVISAAPNLAPGMVGALALAGATLPDGRVIAAHEYAGVVSEAMLCSAAELGLGEISDTLLQLPRDIVPGTPLAEVYGLPDCELEIDVTANRGDCLSMTGIARELHASSGAPLTLPVIEALAPAHDEVESVEVVATTACPRYLGRVISGLGVDTSTPLWMSERLRRAGQRTTHPVVDVLNYVMLELGQPLHAFDRKKLNGGIQVRQAEPGERLHLLSGAEAELNGDMLVIADADKPIALAGIMGGAESAVTPATRDIFIESAWFDPAAIRGRARRLGLVSEASMRYERGVDPALARAALERASALIIEIAGGRPGPIVAAEHASALPMREPITLRAATLARLLGFQPDTEDVIEILARLGLAPERLDEAVRVTPPSARFDLEGEADIVEEVARIAGYDLIPAVAPMRRLATPRLASRAQLQERLTALLLARGYDEAITLSLVAADRDAAFAPADSAPLVLGNPLSERESVLRRSLWPGLLGALAHNVARQAERVRLFEIGTTFDGAGGESNRLAAVLYGPALPEQWGSAQRETDFYDLKGDVEALLAVAGPSAPEFEVSTRAGLAPGRAARALIAGVPVAEFGVIAPALAAQQDLPASSLLLELNLGALGAPDVVRAQGVPRFPSVRRDLALVVPARVSAAELLDGVRKHGGGRLSALSVFDVYTGAGIPDGSRGIGLGLIFRDFCRTLTDAEVDAAVSAIITGLSEEVGIHVRG